MKILVVEDDQFIAKALADALNEQLFVVDIATDSQAGFEQAQAGDYDLIVLDVMLPKLDGMTLFQKLRFLNKNIPILLLTARDNSQNMRKSLDVGVDDYIVQRFNLEELLEIIRALLARQNKYSYVIKKWAGLYLDPQSCQVTYNQKYLNLTPKEYKILNLFINNPQRVFNSSLILDKVWDLGEIPKRDTVRSHIKGLRQKLKSVGAPTDLIETVYGLGYRLKQPNNNLPLKNKKKNDKNQPNEFPEVKGSKQKIQESIKINWDQLKLSISERIDALAEVAIALKNSKSQTYFQNKAQEEAHELADHLGIFDLVYSSNLAREIEKLLASELPLNYTKIYQISKLLKNRYNEIDRHIIIDNEQPKNQDILSLDSQIYTPISLTYPDNFHQKCKLLLILEDTLLAKKLVQEAATKKIECILAKDDKLLKGIDIDAYFDNHSNSMSPNLLFSTNIVLLDFGINPNPEKILTKITCNMPFSPIVVLNNQGELSDRIKIAKLGASAYLTKQLPAAKVIDVVLNIWRKNQIPETVMIVDNDLTTLEIIKQTLTQWRIKAVTLNDERYFWKTLEQTVPDLLILGLEMPHFNGIDLCKVIRNDPHWSKIPVVFITPYQAPDLSHQIFAAGADAYISKPFTSYDLATRIIHRIKRSPSI